MAARKAEATGEVLRRWRGSMKLDRAAIYASDRLGFDISSETVRRYETQYPVDKMDAQVLVALAEVYDKPLTDLPEAARERINRARDLLNARTGWLSAA